MSSLARFLKEFEKTFDWKSHEEVLDHYHKSLIDIINSLDTLNLNKFTLSSAVPKNVPFQFNLNKCYGLNEILPFLDWQHVRDCKTNYIFSIGSIIGPDKDSFIFSKNIALKVYHQKEDQVGRPWGILSDEFLTGVSGRVSMGTEDDTERSSRFFHSSEPRCIQFISKDKSFVGLSLQWGKVEGNPWFFDENVQTHYDETIMKITDVKEYYEDFAVNYEKNMKKWGYFLPRLVFKSFEQAICPLPPKSSKILDLGCGDGLIGQVFHDEGFTDLTGFDFSSSMISKSKEKNIYDTLHQGDLLQTLPFESNAFDILLCISVTTYIKPFVLNEWIRVVRPGGYLIFSHKSSVSLIWEPEQKNIENQDQWNLIYVTDPPVMFLPLLKEGQTQKPCEEKAKIYVYKKSSVSS